MNKNSDVCKADMKNDCLNYHTNLYTLGNYTMRVNDKRHLTNLVNGSSAKFVVLCTKEFFFSV